MDAMQPMSIHIEDSNHGRLTKNTKHHLSKLDVSSNHDPDFVASESLEADSPFSERPFTPCPSLSNDDTIESTMNGKPYTTIECHDDFYRIFQNEIPESEKLVYSNSFESNVNSLFLVFRCALERQVLVDGRLWLTEKHICFKANVFKVIKFLVSYLNF